MKNTTDHQNVDEIDCLEAIDNLYAYLDGELNDEIILAKFKNHLSHCDSCYTRSELEGAISEKIKNTKKETTPESLQDRLRNLMEKL
ncbi:MAG: zf-HC2 domain-containing protein [Gammaproteobacteria bacterium]|nr:zf-HC2 domain-containing protein [Gammaproteobacteria bacterium]